MVWLWKTITGQLGISRFLQSPFNIMLVRHLPIWITRGYIQVLGRIFMGCKPGLKKRIDDHLTAALEQGAILPPIAMLNKTLHGILSHYYEKLFVAFFNFTEVCLFLRRRVAINGHELLDQALGQGRGVILVTGHYGAVEFLPLTLALQGYPVTMLLRYKTRKLKESLTRRAENIDIDLVDVDEDKRVIFTALKALKANRILITECDEFGRWCEDRHKRVRFLGTSLRQDRSLGMLQKRSKAPAAMGLVHRNGNDRYQLNLHSLNVEPPNSRNPDISQQALSILEQYIVATPHQWYQWKEADFLLANAVSQSKRPEREFFPSRNIPFTDPFPHIFQT
jgi:KDO2-lipid IV(A) lauroyltransferase